MVYFPLFVYVVLIVILIVILMYYSIKRQHEINRCNHKWVAGFGTWDCELCGEEVLDLPEFIEEKPRYQRTLCKDPKWLTRGRCRKYGHTPVVDDGAYSGSLDGNTWHRCAHCTQCGVAMLEAVGKPR